MRTKAKLIKKEKLRNNYKLTFNNGNKDFFLILHENQNKIYRWLKISRDYNVNHERGWKYAFVRKIELPKDEITVKDFFINEWSKDLKTKNPKNLFIEIEKFVQSLYIKHKNNFNTPFLLFSEQDQKEIRILKQFRTLFLIDYIH